MLVLVCGLPGVGKSYFAKELSRRINAEYLSSDSIRMKILEKRTYSEEEKAKVYELMKTEAQKLLEEGKDVILDATFFLAEYRKWMREAAQVANVPNFEILCTLDEAELKNRLIKRAKEKTESEADFEVYLNVKEMFESLKNDHLEIDTAKEIEENLDKAIEWIRKR